MKVSRHVVRGIEMDRDVHRLNAPAIGASASPPLRIPFQSPLARTDALLAGAVGSIPVRGRRSNTRQIADDSAEL
jgi:hypothetical protein